MTEFQMYPTTVVALPAGGKTSGSFGVTFRGQGQAYVSGQDVVFRGRKVNLHLEVRRDAETGEVSYTDDRYRSPEFGGIEREVSQGYGYEPLPPSHRAAVAEEIRVALAEAWTSEFDAAGLEAHTSQDLHRAERTYAEAKAAFDEAQVALEAAQAAYDAARAARV